MNTPDGPDAKGRDFSTTPEHFPSSQCPSVHSCFTLDFYHSPSLPFLPSWSAGFSFCCRVEFPQNIIPFVPLLFHLYHCCLGIATRKNNAFSLIWFPQWLMLRSSSYNIVRLMMDWKKGSKWMQQNPQYGFALFHTFFFFVKTWRLYYPQCKSIQVSHASPQPQADMTSRLQRSGKQFCLVHFQT